MTSFHLVEMTVIDESKDEFLMSLVSWSACRWVRATVRLSDPFTSQYPY